MSTKKLQIITPIVTSVNGETGDVSLDSLKNPNALSFTGAATGSYDGSSAKTVNIPTIPASLKNPNSITFTGAVSGSYDGSSPMSVPIPTVPSSLKNPNALTFTGADSGSYDGSAAKTVNIPTVPEALKNPNALTFTGAASVSYDGSSAKTVNIPTDYLSTSGGTMSGDLTLNNKLILDSTSYGTSLPSSGVVGQVFFKKA